MFAGQLTFFLGLAVYLHGHQREGTGPLPNCAKHIRRAARVDDCYFFGAVTIGKSSVRNGDAGRPSALKRFTTGQFDHP